MGRCADCGGRGVGCTYYYVKRTKGKPHILRLYPKKLVCDICFQRNYPEEFARHEKKWKENRENEKKKREVIHRALIYYAEHIGIKTEFMTHLIKLYE